MRYGAILSAVCLFCVALQSTAQDAQPRASVAPTVEPAKAGIQVKVFAVRKGDATSLAETLRLVLGQGSSGVQPLRIVPELRTNSIVAVGAAGDLEIIRALLARVEDPSSYRLQPMPQPAPKPADTPVQSGIVRPSVQESRIRFSQPAPKADNAPVRSGGVYPSLLEALQRFNARSPRQDINESAARFDSAKTELERLEALRNERSTTFSSSEMARARLAARLAEIQLEQLPKPPSDRWKDGFKP